MKAAHAASIALLSAPPSYGLPPDVHEAFRATKEGMSKIDFCVPEHHFAISLKDKGCDDQGDEAGSKRLREAVV